MNNDTGAYTERDRATRQGGPCSSVIS